MLFLFCLLEIFELVLIVIDMSKTEKLEIKIQNNLEVLEYIISKNLGGMQLEHFEYKKYIK